jgi:hypothetical protein
VYKQFHCFVGFISSVGDGPHEAGHDDMGTFGMTMWAAFGMTTWAPLMNRHQRLSV